jgi:hypothetical protein
MRGGDDELQFQQNTFFIAQSIIIHILAYDKFKNLVLFMIQPGGAIDIGLADGRITIIIESRGAADIDAHRAICEDTSMAGRFQGDISAF